MEVWGSNTNIVVCTDERRAGNYSGWERGKLTDKEDERQQPPKKINTAFLTWTHSEDAELQKKERKKANISSVLSKSVLDRDGNTADSADDGLLLFTQTEKFFLPLWMNACNSQRCKELQPCAASLSSTCVFINTTLTYLMALTIFHAYEPKNFRLSRCVVGCVCGALKKKPITVRRSVEMSPSHACLQYPNRFIAICLTRIATIVLFCRGRRNKCRKKKKILRGDKNIPF